MKENSPMIARYLHLRHNIEVIESKSSSDIIDVTKNNYFLTPLYLFIGCKVAIKKRRKMSRTDIVTITQRCN